jgi:hypothetical protein
MPGTRTVTAVAQHKKRGLSQGEGFCEYRTGAFQIDGRRFCPSTDDVGKIQRAGKFG